MSILKALQKKQLEQPENEQTVAKIVPFERIAKKNNQPPEMFLEDNFKIGVPTNSAFNEQNVSSIGMALSNVRTDLTTAGATLNAVGLTRTVENLPIQQKSLPDFVTWEVEADRVEPRLVSITQPHSTYNEEYRSLRTHILHKSQKQKLQSIVVASVGASEGKSITALNFSWMLAQTDGIRAIIIDSDLRMPSLADYLGIETDKGLSDVLSGKATLQDSIIKLEPSGLYLLPGGAARSDVAELLSGPKFKEILRQLRDMFDFVVIDAPPLGIFTDAAVLINHADGAIMVVRANRTRYSAVDRILEALPRDRMLGVVLNESEDVLDESHYSYGYYKNTKIRD